MKDATTIRLPWGAWYSDTLHELHLPDHWSVDVLAPSAQGPCSSEDIQAALESPIDSPTPRELARGKQSVCIIVDDLARPTRAYDILPWLLEQLHEGGIPAEAVRIVIATGSHGTLGDDAIALKVGAETAARYRVECHDCRGDLAATGIAYGDRELHVNRTFFEAELKIAIGSVLPHSFAGFSGGAKLVLPGLTDLSAIARSHKFVQLGLRGGLDCDHNKFRREAEELARQIGLSFVVCVVTNQKRETAAVYAGDLVAAHRRACTAAGEFYNTPLYSDYDCLIVNAYPKDTDLIQAENVFVALKTAKAPVVRKGGVILLTTAASQGLGRHGLFEPGGLSYRSPRQLRALGERELWLYAPHVSTEHVRQLYWDGYQVFDQQDDLTAALARRFSQPTDAAVLPCAPMQQIRDMRSLQVEVA